MDIKASVYMVRSGQGRMYLIEPHITVVNGPNSFLNCFFKCPANAHYFSHTLHARTQGSRYPSKLLQIPSWDFNYHIIQTGLKTCTSEFGDFVLKFIQRNS